MPPGGPALLAWVVCPGQPADSRPPVCSYLAAKTPFFVSCFHMLDLRQRDSNLREWCEAQLVKYGYDRLPPSTTTPVGSDFYGTTPITPGPAQFYQDACNVPEYGHLPGGERASINCGHITVLDQCMAEQKWMRESMLRSFLYVQACPPVPHLLPPSAGGMLHFGYVFGFLPHGWRTLCYNGILLGGFCGALGAAPDVIGSSAWQPRGGCQAPGWARAECGYACSQVSISGQAVVFVVRCTGWSLTSRAGILTYAAFFGAQVCSTSSMYEAVPLHHMSGMQQFRTPRAMPV